MERLAKHLVVVSFDAMNSNDLEKIKNYPNFKRLLADSSYSYEVSSISPSLTYPAHTSIITSMYPDKHGIIANTLMQAHRDNPDWFWQHKYIKSPTVYDKALDAKMTVAALLWPVTAKSKITYNFPEIFANRRWKTQIAVSLVNGSAGYQYNLNKKFGKLRDGISQPKLDDFVEASLLYTIKEYRPDLTLVHFVDLDSMRHYYGFDSVQADEALVRHDNRLGSILDLLEDEAMIDDTTIVVLGDHSMKSTHSVISLRRLFEQNGLMTYKRSKLKEYKVITKTADGSTYIYLKDKKEKQKVFDLLNEFKNSTNAVDKILNNEEIKRIHADHTADYLVDANEGYYFSDKLEDLVINKIEMIGNRVKSGYLLSSHGYLQDKEDYKTIFIVKGNQIKKNFNIGPMNLVDEGITFAKILGLDMGNVDGRLLEEIFEDEN